MHQWENPLKIPTALPWITIIQGDSDYPVWSLKVRVPGFGKTFPEVPSLRQLIRDGKSGTISMEEGGHFDDDVTTSPQEGFKAPLLLEASIRSGTEAPAWSSEIMFFNVCFINDTPPPPDGSAGLVFNVKEQARLVVYPITRINDTLQPYWPQQQHDNATIQPLTLFAGYIRISLVEETLSHFMKLFLLSKPHDEHGEKISTDISLTPEGILLEIPLPVPGRKERINGMALLTIEPTSRSDPKKIIPVLIFKPGLTKNMDTWNKWWNELRSALGQDGSAQSQEYAGWFRTELSPSIPELRWHLKPVDFTNTDPEPLDYDSPKGLTIPTQAAILEVSQNQRGPLASTATLKPQEITLIQKDNDLTFSAKGGYTSQINPKDTRLTPQIEIKWVRDTKEKLYTFTCKNIDTVCADLYGLAQSERSRAGLDAPPRTSKENPTLLWAATPIDRGWLTFPVPNLEPLSEREKREQAVAAICSGRGEAFSGVFRLSNETGAAPTDDFPVPKEAPWMIEVHSADSFTGTWTLRQDGDKWKLAKAEISLDSPTLRLSGLLWRHAQPLPPGHLLPSLSAGPSAFEQITLNYEPNAETTNKDILSFHLTTCEVTSDKNGTPSIGAMTLTAKWLTQLHENQDDDQKNAPTPQAIAWLRHDRLPMASAMPMVHAGAAALSPQENRDLAPFQVIHRKNPSAPDIVELFSLVTFSKETMTQWPSLGNFNLETHRSWPAPKAPKDGNTPHDGSPFSLVGLPGVEAFPFSPPNKTIIRLQGGASGWQDTSFAWRADLPLLDELFASASLPPSPETQESNEFPVPTSGEYTAFWDRQYTRLALSKGQDIYLKHFSDTGAEISITNLLPPFTWKTGLTVTLGNAAEMPLGGLRFTQGAKFFEKQGDNALEGLTGNISLAGDTLVYTPEGEKVPPADVTIPMCRLSPAGYERDGLLYDARNYGFGATAAETPDALYAIRRMATNGPVNPRTFCSVSLRSFAPLTIPPDSNWRIGFFDLPMEKAETTSNPDTTSKTSVWRLHHATPNPVGPDSQAWSDEHLPFQNHTWSLWSTAAESGEPRLDFFGFRFVPLRLRNVVIPRTDDQDDPVASPSEITIVGRLEMGQPFPAEGESLDNLVELTFTVGKDEEHGLTLSGVKEQVKSCRWRLTIVTPDIPVDDIWLHGVPKLSNCELELAEAHLEFDFQGFTWKSPAAINGSIADQIVVECKQDEHSRSLRMTKLALEVELSSGCAHVTAMDVVLCLPEKVSKPTVFKLVSSLQETSCKWLNLTFTIPHSKTLFTSGHTSLCLDWTKGQVSTEKSELIPGLSLQNYLLNGGLGVSLGLGKETTPLDSLPRLEAKVWYLEMMAVPPKRGTSLDKLSFRHMLAHPLTKQNQTGIPRPGLEISGTLEIQSRIGWPQATIDNTKAQMTVPASPPMATHTVKILLSGHSLDLANLDLQNGAYALKTSWNLLAVAQHTLKTDATAPLPWGSLDMLRLTTPGILRQTKSDPAFTPAKRGNASWMIHDGIGQSAKVFQGFDSEAFLGTLPKSPENELLLLGSCLGLSKTKTGSKPLSLPYLAKLKKVADDKIDFPQSESKKIVINFSGHDFRDSDITFSEMPQTVLVSSSASDANATKLNKILGEVCAADVVEQCFCKEEPASQAVLWPRSLLLLHRFLGREQNNTSPWFASLVLVGDANGISKGAVLVEITPRTPPREPSPAMSLTLLSAGPDNLEAMPWPESEFDGDRKDALARDLAETLHRFPVFALLRNDQASGVALQALRLPAPLGLDLVGKDRLLRIPENAIFADAKLGWTNQVALQVGDLPGWFHGPEAGGDWPLANEIGGSGLATVVAYAPYAGAPVIWGVTGATQGKLAKTLLWRLHARQVCYPAFAPEDLRTPPILSLTPVWARQRVPGNELVEAALKPLLEENTHLQPTCAPWIDQLHMGERAGIMMAWREALTVPNDDLQGEDPAPNQGLPGVLGRGVLRQSRVPRPYPLPANTGDPARDRRVCAGPGEPNVNCKLVRGPADFMFGKTDKFYYTIIAAMDTKPYGIVTEAWNGEAKLTLEVWLTPVTKGMPDKNVIDWLNTNIFKTNSYKAKLSIGSFNLEYGYTKVDDKPISEWAQENCGIRGVAVLALKGGLEGIYQQVTQSPVLPEAAIVISFGEAVRDSGIFYKDRDAPAKLRLPLTVRRSDRGGLPLAPLTILFIDPAYDRELVSGVIMTQKENPKNKSSLTLYVDRKSWNPAESLLVMVTYTTKKTGENGEPLPASSSVRITARMKHGDGRDGPEVPLVENAPAEELLHRVFDLDLRRLFDKPTGPVFKPGDILELKAYDVNANDFSVTIPMPVVNTPLFPAPQSVYAVMLRLKKRNVEGEDICCCDTALFGSGVRPSTMTALDVVNGFKQGLITRKSGFSWKLVRHVSELDSNLGAFVVKMDRTGATHIPETTVELISIKLDTTNLPIGPDSM